MRIMGIDPGSRICGWGVIEELRRGGKLVHIDCGIIAPNPKLPLPDRLVAIYDGIKKAIETYHPEEVGIETAFFAKNAKSALVLGQARGVAIIAARHCELPVFEYAPTMIKQAVCGSGRAEKLQVARMVKALLCLPEIAQSDASDALACAICHTNSRRINKALSK